jgi:hypothetical protein
MNKSGRSAKLKGSMSFCCISTWTTTTMAMEVIRLSSRTAATSKNKDGMNSIL